MALPFLHSVVRYDTTTSFHGKSKKFWYELRMKQIDESEDITSAFTQLCSLPSTETFKENFRELENVMMSDYNLKDKNLR